MAGFHFRQAEHEETLCLSSFINRIFKNNGTLKQGNLSFNTPFALLFIAIPFRESFVFSLWSQAVAEVSTAGCSIVENHSSEDSSSAGSSTGTAWLASSSAALRSSSEISVVSSSSSCSARAKVTTRASSLKRMTRTPDA